jgi:hypothetical protein
MPAGKHARVPFTQAETSAILTVTGEAGVAPGDIRTATRVKPAAPGAGPPAASVPGPRTAGNCQPRRHGGNMAD